MSDRRRHRGPHPQDRELFAPPEWPKLQAAVCDVSWLWTRRYSQDATIKLVGDRYGLKKRQRLAVLRGACSDQARRRRSARRVSSHQLHGAALQLDGFNVLTTIEAAIAGGVLLECRDGAIRDMASIHGSYRIVEETETAIEQIASLLLEREIGAACWWLDAPVSNSGRLAQLLRRMADRHDWPWTVHVDNNVDRRLIESEEIVATSDSVVVDGCRYWYPLSTELIARFRRHDDSLWIVPLISRRSGLPS